MGKVSMTPQFKMELPLIKEDLD